VTINLDAAEDKIDCFVRSVAGPIATLGHLGEIPPHVRERLSPGLLGYLTFSHEGVLSALRGVATVDCATEPDLAFVALDGIKLPERRNAARVELAITAHVFRVFEDGMRSPNRVESVTADLSLGGTLIERRPGLVMGMQLQVELYFEAFPDPLCCDAVVTRQTSSKLGLRFTEMQETDRVRLAEILAHHRRSRIG
jgi:hypothetical protein